jgi:hypothetical protein
MDTVYANSSSRYVVMHWGNPAARDASGGPAVFDTAVGFQGVWHLGGAGSDTAQDATANGYDGAAYGMTPASGVSGAIGMAREFDGSSSYIRMNNTASGSLDFAQNGGYSISAWVYVDTFDTIWHEIAGKGHEQYYLKVKCMRDSALWEFVEYQDRSGWAFTQVPNPPDAKTWVHLVGVRSGNRQSLFVNGRMVCDSIGIQAGTVPFNRSDDFSIGRYVREVFIPYYEGYCYFDGAIDEVRVSSRPLSADWITLCYMNQKAVDALVIYK